MKVALYARVSTDLTEDDLRTANGDVVYRQNPEVQLIKLRAFVENHRWENVAEYVDRASGRDASRPAFDKMMEAAFRHEFDSILVVRIDRIMRSLKNLHNVLENLKEWRVKLLATDQQLDMDTANGRLMVNFLGMLAEWESDNTSVRVIDGMDRARLKGTKSGLPIGRTPTYDEEKLDEARRIKAENPCINWSELERRTGICRRTLKRKLTEGGQKEGSVSL